jgi:hypothetical protein
MYRSLSLYLHIAIRDTDHLQDGRIQFHQTKEVQYWYIESHFLIFVFAYQKIRAFLEEIRVRPLLNI